MKIVNLVANNQYRYGYNISKNNNQPSFGSMGFTFGTYKDCFGITRETQNTTGKREDLSLEDFANIVKWRFRNFDKVNVMPMNVSDGTEAYLMANAIIRNEGLKAFEKKYSPILASDVMKNVIDNYAKNGLLHLFNDEIIEFDRLGINVLEEVNIDDYKDKIIPQIRIPDKLYKLSDEYRKYFDFQTKDLQARIYDLKDNGNSIIAIRNCLKQSFGETMSSILIIKLAMKMNGASLLITGDYDRSSKAIEKTLKEYFVELKHNIWGLREFGFIKNYAAKII